ncbi:MAG: glycosyltransferase [Nitrospirae bacterium]|nr:glycosyltransferase [Nitrospirota bacterium]
MSTSPLVSIITPCFNAAGTIRDTIESVLGQTYPNIEYIVIDGGSSDGTVDIIREYEPRFRDRMRWVSEPDGGIYDAMNKGIRMARGEIIGTINADDWYERDAVERIVAVATGTTGSFIITGRVCICDLHGKKLYHQDACADVAGNVKRFMPVWQAATFVSKAAYDKAGLFDTSFKISADYDFVFRAVLAGVEFIVSDADVSNMRFGGVSAVGVGNDNLRATEDNRVRRKNGLPYYAAFRLLVDLAMNRYRRIKRRLFGRFFVMKRIELE